MDITDVDNGIKLAHVQFDLREDVLHLKQKECPTPSSVVCFVEYLLLETVDTYK